MTKDPKVSVITVCYNAEEFIQNNISSVNNQNYSNIEQIFIDGLSNDKTVKTVKDNARTTYKLISEPDDGIYNAMNKGIRLASGKFLIFLNSDDMFAHDSVISNFVECIKEHSPDIIFSNVSLIKRNKKDKIFRTWKAGNFNKRKLKFGWMPPHPGVLLKLSLFKKFGGFDEKFKISGDYDFLLRIFCNMDVKIFYLNQYSVIMRNGGESSKNYKNIFIKWKEDLIAVKKNNVGSILTVLLKRIRKLNQFL